MEHRSKKCPRKIEVQNMFRINATITPKPSKTNNVLVDVIVVVTTHSQQLEQQMSMEREPIKTKGPEEW
jgi:hypothetical protein